MLEGAIDCSAIGACFGPVLDALVNRRGIYYLLIAATTRKALCTIHGKRTTHNCKLAPLPSPRPSFFQKHSTSHNLVNQTAQPILLAANPLDNSFYLIAVRELDVRSGSVDHQFFGQTPGDLILVLQQ